MLPGSELTFSNKIGYPCDLCVLRSAVQGGVRMIGRKNRAYPASILLLAALYPFPLPHVGQSRNPILKARSPRSALLIFSLFVDVRTLIYRVLLSI